MLIFLFCICNLTGKGRTCAWCRGAFFARGCVRQEAAAAVAGALPCVCLLAGEAVSVCKTARFAIQNVPFRKLKRTVSQPPVPQLVVCSGRKALPQGVDVVRRQPCSGALLECGLCVGGLGKAVAACRGRAGRGRRRAARLILQRGSRPQPICPRRPCR